MTHIKEFCIGCGIAITSYLSPVIPTMITVGFLILADTIFGIYKAKKLGEKITSRKLGNIIPKLALYQLAIVSLYLMEKHILGWNDMTLVKGGALVISTVEILSIDESFKKIFGYSIWSKIKGQLKRGDSNTK